MSEQTPTHAQVMAAYERSDGVRHALTLVQGHVAAQCGHVTDGTYEALIEVADLLLAASREASTHATSLAQALDRAEDAAAH